MRVWNRHRSFGPAVRRRRFLHYSLALKGLNEPPVLNKHHANFYLSVSLGNGAIYKKFSGWGGIGHLCNAW